MRDSIFVLRLPRKEVERLVNLFQSDEEGDEIELATFFMFLYSRMVKFLNSKLK